MAAFLQTTFSNAFFSMKMYEFDLRFHWNLFLRFKLTIFQHWFRWWLDANQATSQYADPVHWCIYAALEGDVLNSWHSHLKAMAFMVCIPMMFVFALDMIWWLLMPIYQQTLLWTSHREVVFILLLFGTYWSGHKTVAVLLPGFAINW